MKGGFAIKRENVPQFGMSLKQTLPADPRDCRSCSLCKNSQSRVPLPAGGKRKLLIVNRPLAPALVKEGIHFTPEEKAFLSKWMEAIGLDLDRDCVVTARVLCPVQDSSQLSEDSLNACLPYFDRVLSSVKPEVVLQLGVNESESLAGMTGGIPFFRTHHPADVLINGELKRPVWENLKRIKGVLIGN